MHLLRLQNLLRGQQLLESPPHFENGPELLRHDEPPQLVGKVGDGAELGDLPVEEATQISDVLKVESE